MFQKRVCWGREKEGGKASGMYCCITEKERGGKGRNACNIIESLGNWH